MRSVFFTMQDETEERRMRCQRRFACESWPSDVMLSPEIFLSSTVCSFFFFCVELFFSCYVVPG